MAIPMGNPLKTPLVENNGVTVTTDHTVESNARTQRS